MNEERPWDIHERTFEFACGIIRLHERLRREQGATRVLLSQLLRCGTSIGANLEEARAGQSRADFIAKSRIALKEARESHYWLRLLAATSIARRGLVDPMVSEANELVAILTSILRKASPRRT